MKFLQSFVKILYCAIVISVIFQDLLQWEGRQSYLNRELIVKLNYDLDCTVHVVE